MEVHFSWKRAETLQNTIDFVIKVGLWLRLDSQYPNENQPLKSLSYKTNKLGLGYKIILPAADNLDCIFLVTGFGVLAAFCSICLDISAHLLFGLVFCITLDGGSAFSGVFSLSSAST